MSEGPELDDRFIYEEVRTFSGETYYLRVDCRHRHVESVLSHVTGEEVARLCLDCDTQLPSGFR